MNTELIKITKLDPIIWEDCNDGTCQEESIYGVENLKHGAILYSCESHLYDLIKFEMDTN